MYINYKWHYKYIYSNLEQADPGLLAVASEVAELERDVDKESVDDLFTRAWYHRDHRKTIRLLHQAAPGSAL